MLEVDQQLNAACDDAKELGMKIGNFCEMLSDLFPEINEIDLYSEKELKKKIKYSKTPMERKRWQDMLQKKYKKRRTK